MIEITALASGSTGNCYHVTDGHTPLLLECGISYKLIQQGLNYRVTSLAGCLLSHEHGDHAKAIKDMTKAGIDCYMTKGTAEALSLTGHRLRIVSARKQFHIGSWVVLPFETQHDAVEPVGFLLANSAGEKLLYATDTYYIRYRFKGLTHVMVECNYSMEILRKNVQAGLVEPALKNRILKSHFSLENVKEFLLANDLSKVQEIWLLHLSDGNSNSERFKREVKEISGKPVYIA